MAQNSDNTFRIPAPSDEQIVRTFSNIIAASGAGGQATVHLGNMNIGSFGTADEFLKTNKSKWNETKSINYIY